MMDAWYRLEGHTPVLTSMEDAAQVLAAVDSRRVGYDELAPDVSVSTVFLGLDHGYGDGLPILFESMVFGSALDGEQKRYATWAEAEAGHARMVARVRAALESPP